MGYEDNDYNGSQQADDEMESSIARDFKSGIRTDGSV